MIKIAGLKLRASNAAKAFDIDTADFVSWIKLGIKGSYEKVENKKIVNMEVQVDLEEEKVGVFARKIVVEEERDSEREIDLEGLKLRQLKGKLGDYISFDVTSEKLRPVIDAVLNLVDTVSKEELSKGASRKLSNWYQKVKDKAVTGMMLKSSGTDWIIYFGGVEIEATLPASERLEKDTLEVGGELIVTVKEIAGEGASQKLILTRRSDEVLMEAVQQSIKHTGKSIEVKAVAREPGKANKIAVKSNNENVNAVSTCQGKDNANGKKIEALLAGERTEFVRWYDSDEKFIASALGPIPIKSIQINKAKREATVEVFKGGEKDIVGIGGTNKLLAELLTGYSLPIIVSSQAFSGTEFDVKDKSK